MWATVMCSMPPEPAPLTTIELLCAAPPPLSLPATDIDAPPAALRARIVSDGPVKQVASVAPS
jgi:hypothetical protein